MHLPCRVLKRFTSHITHCVPEPPLRGLSTVIVFVRKKRFPEKQMVDILQGSSKARSLTGTAVSLGRWRSRATANARWLPISAQDAHHRRGNVPRLAPLLTPKLKEALAAE
jgi:hypothetical protein